MDKIKTKVNRIVSIKYYDWNDCNITEYVRILTEIAKYFGSNLDLKLRKMNEKEIAYVKSHYDKPEQIVLIWITPLDDMANKIFTNLSKMNLLFTKIKHIDIYK